MPDDNDNLELFCYNNLDIDYKYSLLGFILLWLIEAWFYKDGYLDIFV